MGFSIRNVLWARSVDRAALQRALEREGWGQWESAKRDRGELVPLPTTTRAILDAEVSMAWFPQPARDNSGDRYSLADFDVGFYPFRYFSMRSRNFFDPNEGFEYNLTDNSISVEPLPRVLRFTVGERFRPDVSEFLYGQVAVELGRRYSLEAYYGWDLDDSDRTDVEVRLIRFMHRFALETSYSFDAGERDNHTVSFNFYPVEIFDSFWERRGRFDYDTRLGEDGR